MTGGWRFIFIRHPQNLYAAFTRYEAVRPIPFTATAIIVRQFTPGDLQMHDIAYLAGLLIAFGLLYGFSFACGRL